MNTREYWLEKGFSEEQITQVLNSFHETNKQNQTLQTQLANMKEFENKYNDVQKQLDDINRANLSKEEQIALKEKALAQKEQDILAKEMATNKSYNVAKVKNILAGYDVDDDLLLSLVNDNEESSIKNANLLKARLDTYADTSIKKAKEQISNINVKPNPSNVQTEGMTWDKFSSLSIEEQNRFQVEHPDEFNNL